MAKSNFFIWASGANTKIIARMEEALRPSEFNKFLGIGVAVCFTSVMAVISASFALRYLVKDEFGNPNWLAAIALAVFWGGFIFFLDRTIVSSVKKTKDLKKNFRMALPRMLLALIFAFIISKPLEIELFRHAFQTMEAQVASDATSFHGLKIDSVKTENEKLRSEIDDFDIDKYTKVARNRFKNRDSIGQITIARNNTLIEQLNHKVDVLVNLRRNELNVSSWNILISQINKIPADSLRTESESKLHDSLQNKRKRWIEYRNEILKHQNERIPLENQKKKVAATIDSLRIAYEQVENEADNYFRNTLAPTNNTKIAKNNELIAKLLGDREVSKSNYKGIWADLRTYQAYKKDKPDIQIAGWLIFVLLLGFEMAPILTKMAFPYSQYDRLLQQLDAKEIPIETSNERQQHTDSKLRKDLEPHLKNAMEELGKLQNQIIEKEVTGDDAKARFLSLKNHIRQLYYLNDNPEEEFERFHKDLKAQSQQLKNKITKDTNEFNAKLVQWANQQMINNVDQLLNYSSSNKEVFREVDQYIRKNGVEQLISSAEPINYPKLKQLHQKLIKTKAAIELDLQNGHSDFMDTDDSFYMQPQQQNREWIDNIVNTLRKGPILVLMVAIIPIYLGIAYFSDLWPFNQKGIAITSQEWTIYEEPSFSGQKISVISELSDLMPQGDTLKDYYYTSGDNGVMGNWVKVNHQDNSGWIFDEKISGLSVTSITANTNFYSFPDSGSQILNTFSSGQKFVLLDEYGPADTLTVGNNLFRDRWLKLGDETAVGWIFGYFTDNGSSELVASAEGTGSHQGSEKPGALPKYKPVSKQKSGPSGNSVKNPQQTKVIENPESSDTSNIKKESQITYVSDTLNERSAENGQNSGRVEDQTKQVKRTDTTATIKKQERTLKTNDTLICIGDSVQLFKTVLRKKKIKAGAKHDILMQKGQECIFISMKGDTYIIKYQGKKYLVHKKNMELKN